LIIRVVLNVFNKLNNILIINVRIKSNRTHMDVNKNQINDFFYVTN